MSTPTVEAAPSVASRAADAKAEGKKQVTFPSQVVTYPVTATGLKHAASEFSVVVGTPRASQTVIQDGSSISTWYSIEVKDVVVNRSCEMCKLLTVDGLPASLRPTHLLPVPAHSMLLIRRGGITVSDGVTVTETEYGVATLELNKDYLFVVDKSSNGIARLVLNDAGIFTVGEDGETLTPITPANHAKTQTTAGAKFPTLKELRQASQPGN